MTPARVVCWLAVLSLATAGCRGEAARPEKPPRPVRVVEAAIPPVALGARYSGTISAAERVPLAFRSAGYVDSLLQTRGPAAAPRDVQPGDEVPQGAVLASVRDDDYRVRVALVEARLSEAQAAETKARLDLERAERLFEARSLTRPELDAARFAAQTADARLAATRAEVQLAHLALGDTALRAPRAGVVLERLVERGSLVGAGTPAFVVADLSSVKLVFGVPDALVQTLRPGMTLALTTEAVRGRDFSGRITNIAPAADSQTRVFSVEVSVANTDRVLRPGMIATVRLGGPQEERSGTPALPLSAIVKHESSPTGYALFVVQESDGRTTARLRSVRLGDVVGNEIEVTEGLAPGESIVVSGAMLLQDGEAVRVIP
jgi:multidrug efflux system membrane fusion protein